jgi:hypothetical protein
MISNEIRLNNIRWSEERSQKLEEIFQTIFKPTSYFRLPTSDFQLRTSDFGLPTSDFQLRTSIFKFIETKASALQGFNL